MPKRQVPATVRPLAEKAVGFIRETETFFRWVRAEKMLGVHDPRLVAAESYGERALELQRKVFDLADGLERHGRELAAEMERQAEDSTDVFLFTDAACRISPAKALKLWPALRARLERMAVRLTATPPAGGGRVTRNLRPRRADRPLTPKQLNALELIATHKGNMSEAARAAGVSRATMKKHVDAANKKLALTEPHGKRIQTCRLPKDRRGQANIAARDDGE
jgi:DNA-binding CsgD family transcriptional regulator